MEEKILYNVLKKLSRGENYHDSAPDKKYIQSLVEIGIIKDGWDQTISPLGLEILKMLENKLHPW